MSIELLELNEGFENKLDMIQHLVDVTLSEMSTEDRDFRVGIRKAMTLGSTLLVAATFEDHVRKSAIAFARYKLDEAKRTSKLHPEFKKTIKLSINSFIKHQILKKEMKNETLSEYETRLKQQLDELFSLIMADKGDYKHDVSKQVVKTERNLKSKEINRLFYTIGIKGICESICFHNNNFQKILNEYDNRKLFEKFTERLDEFYDERNTIAHSLDSSTTEYPDDLIEIIKFFREFGRTLYIILKSKLN